MDKLDFSKLDPSMLNKPLSELGIKPGDTEGNEGIPVIIPDEMKPAEKKEEGQQAPSPTLDDDGKVPYTRFKKFHDRAIEAEEEADFWRRKAEQREEVYRAPTPTNTEVAYDGDDWLKFKTLWGDTEQSREAYKIELQRLSAMEDRATQRAMDAIERRNSEQQESYRENLAVVDQNLEEASDILGRQLSSDEELAILEIQDDYSPKDRDGNISALIPVEKAVEIWQMQQARSPRREARNSVAALSGGSAAGEGDSTPKAGENYNPRGGWRQVFGKTK